MGGKRSSSGGKPAMRAEDFSRALLGWYDRAGRTLPWRVREGRPDPYHVWLSEIMLQQTTVAAVKPYFEKFLRHWPHVKALARAGEDEVLREWAGLGYYSRARNLLKCARRVEAEHGGKFPQDEKALKSLPGVGDYTAAAIAAIAFGRPAVVVDGNVERVIARLFAIARPVKEMKSDIRSRAADLTPEARAGDYAQALMDLGAVICTPKMPRCLVCPVEGFCAAKQQGIAADLPVRGTVREKPLRYGAVFWMQRDGDVWLRRRPSRGLLGGMPEVPGTPWDTRAAEKRCDPVFPVDADWAHTGEVRHTFTHFHLRLAVYTAAVETDPAGDGFWVPVADLDQAGLPTLMRKVVRLVLPEKGQG